LDELAGIVGGTLDGYAPDAAVSAIARFLDVLNNWYIRLNRQRFWDEDQAAFDILWHVLTTVCKLLAPFAPFVSDYIFRNLTGAESVHLERFQKSENIKSRITAGMRKAQSIVSVGKQLREKYGLRNRLPLASLEIAGWNDSEFDDIIKNELNVKEVRHGDVAKVADSFVYLITPKIGARIGGKLKEIIAAAKQPGFNPDDWGLLADEFEKRLNVKDGIAGAALPDNTAVVVLDTNLTPELVAEGLANDALRFIQDTRKAVGLDVSDRIKLAVSGDAEIVRSLKIHERRVMTDVLATEITYSDEPREHAAEIENRKFSVKITKIQKEQK
jgi:isoleucyl-tRNA synthetase